MQISCKNCGKKFIIPDEKVPDVPRFGVKCPSCGNKIVVERGAAKGEVVEEEKERRIVPKQVEPEMFPPGSIVAFLYLEDEMIGDKCEEVLKGEGYEISRTGDPGEALARLMLNRYDLVLLADSEDGRELLAEVGRWPGRNRREVNVIMLGERTSTFDPATEFIMAINSYISVDDIERIGEILKESIARHREYLVPWRYVQGDEKQ